MREIGIHYFAGGHAAALRASQASRILKNLFGHCLAEWKERDSLVVAEVPHRVGCECLFEPEARFPPRRLDPDRYQTCNLRYGDLSLVMAADEPDSCDKGGSVHAELRTPKANIAVIVVKSACIITRFGLD